MTLTCAKILLEQYFEKANIYFAPNDVFYELCRTFIEARLFTITYVLEILTSGFRPNDGEIVKMSRNKIRINDLY